MLLMMTRLYNDYEAIMRRIAMLLMMLCSVLFLCAYSHCPFVFSLCAYVHHFVC